jgi:Bacterial PH domain
VRNAIALGRKLVRFELSLYRSLFRWVTRRPDVPVYAGAFAYFGAVAVVVWAFIIVSAVETVVFHVILPWEVVRLVVDIVSIWGLLWMFGYAASLNVYPHLVDDTGVRVRNGTSTDFTVPWEAIASVGARERSRDRSKAVQVDHDETGDKGDTVHVVMSSRTNVELRLRHPLVVPLHTGDETVTEVRFFADDARALANRVRSRLAEREQARR